MKFRLKGQNEKIKIGLVHDIENEYHEKGDNQCRFKSLFRIENESKKNVLEETLMKSISEADKEN